MKNCINKNTTDFLNNFYVSIYISNNVYSCIDINNVLIYELTVKTYGESRIYFYAKAFYTVVFCSIQRDLKYRSLQF